MASSQFLIQVKQAIIASNFSARTERTYLDWIKRYIVFHNKRHPGKMGEAEVSQFLDYLANKRKVSPSTQNQALNALVFLYKDILKMGYGNFDNIERARKPAKPPHVLTPEEVSQLLDQLSGEQWLMVSLLYGSGLRLLECLRLRVQDLDLETRTIFVRSGKHNEDRVTVIPETALPQLEQYLEQLREKHEKDLEFGLADVYLPQAVLSRQPEARREWLWQYVFPARKRSIDPKTDKPYRHHYYPKTLQAAIKTAARKANIKSGVSCHSLRHSFAARMLETGQSIEKVQSLLGHSDPRSTQIYTQILEAAQEQVAAG